MTKEEIYSTWAPAESFWSTWAKPVLFAHLNEHFESPAALPLQDVSWAPAIEGRTALVLDFPCDEGVWVGLALARSGYRPVPLYNAIPHPFVTSVLSPVSAHSVVAVNVIPIAVALRQGADVLATLTIPPYAPPVFLLDANRYGDGLRRNPGEFDNRSVCFTTDFPSANFLCAHGISRVLLVQRSRMIPQRDLSQVLCRWQEGGLALERLQIETPSVRESFQVSRPAWYGAMFQRALAAIGLRRAFGGGFGGWVPEPSAGG